MAEEVVKGWNVSSKANLAFILVLLAACGAAIGLSVVDLFGIPLVFSEGGQAAELVALPGMEGLSFELAGRSATLIEVGDSPHAVGVDVSSPPLLEGESITLFVVSGGRIVSETTCAGFGAEEVAVTGGGLISCEVPLAYNYATVEDVSVYAVLESGEGGKKLAAYAMPLRIDWGGYEPFFWGSSFFMLLAAGAGLLLVALVAAAMLYFATRIRHESEYAGEYSVGSALLPMKNAKTVPQKAQAFIASPAFWAVELFGIFLLVAYLAISVEAWKSPSAGFAFAISGALAFITPFLWSAAVWFIDYKEREPLRLVVSMFLWGGFSCLMAIGINSIAGLFFLACGVGFLAASFTAPVFEELSKGTGLALLSLHHEYDGMTDGIVYGFVVGMGFAFVENWLYLLRNPMGADFWGWLLLFFMRSLAFSANHGVFTALTGGFIGLLKQWRFKYATLGLLAGIIPAMLFHAIHNSGEIWGALFGGFGLLAYCCFLLPLFDYGGLVLVALLLIGGVVFTQGSKKRAR